jgi:hypothetical protein
MASYNQGFGSNDNLGIINQGGGENRGVFNKMLRRLSNLGMEYEDMIFKNQVGIGANEDPNAMRTSMYDFFSQRAVARVLGKKAIPYLDKAYVDKKRILREYSVKDEIRDFVSTLADDCIIYNEKDFCHPKPLGQEYSQDIRDKYQEVFEKVYNKYSFNDSISAWNMMKDFLIDGFISNEIIKRKILYISIKLHQKLLCLDMNQGLVIYGFNFRKTHN